VIDQLAADLRSAFPEMSGFSPRNLKYMRAFAEAWPDEDFVQQVAAQLPWFHNCTILDKLKTLAERTWYAQQTIVGLNRVYCAKVFHDPRSFCPSRCQFQHVYEENT
jgi:predicted nuclease of restriction endonuclease-like (RecB) superfamily